MDLLTPAQHAQIRSAIQDVADTFHKSVITYKRYIGSVDRFNEDREDTKYEIYTIPCMVIFSDFDRDKSHEYEEGSVSRNEVQVQMLYDNLERMGLTTSDNKTVFRETTDFFIHKGREYKVVYVGLDGPMEDKNLLVKVYGDPVPRSAF